MRCSVYRSQKCFLPQGVSGRAMAAALLVALALPTVAACLLDTLPAPAKPPLEPALFTAYIAPHEWRSCRFIATDGRIGFGYICTPDSTSVFIPHPSHPFILPGYWGPRPPLAPPNVDIPITIPDFDAP